MRRYGKGTIVTDDDFARAKAIQKLGRDNAGSTPEKSLELPIATPAGPNIGMSVRIAPGRKERAISVAAPDNQASVCSILLDAFGAQCFAYMQFGAGSVQSEAEVDIGRGCSLDIPMSALTLDLLNDSTVGTTEAIVKAYIGWMASGGHPSARPTRTFARTVGYIQSGYQNPVTAGQSLSAVAAAASRIIVPPNFARDILVVRTPSTEPFRLEFLDETGAVELYEQNYGAGANQERPTEISNDCKLIRIVNTGAGATTYRAIFGLGL